MNNMYESVVSTVDQDYQSKKDMNLSSFTRKELSQSIVDKYKSDYKQLSHVRINKNTKGYIWLDGDSLVGFINVEDKDGDKWINSFEIFGKYKKHGLSKQMMDVAMRDLKATHLSVNKKNNVAIKIYKSIGFNTYKETDTMLFMSINKSYVEESNKDSEYSYSSLSSSKDIADFNKNMKIVFKSSNDMSKEKTHKSMKAIKFNNEIIGYIGFSRYNIDGKKYLGIGNFMIIPRYQSSGHGTKIIKDIINRYKDTYDEIYCYVEKENTKAIQFYKRIADVNTKNLTKYGYYVTLYSKGRSSSNESYTQEGYIKDDNDIYYNKDKFDSGEINLCFITGLSGSGKSTMGRSMSSKNVEHCEMDDVICNDNFNDANLKEYGSLIESFFKGPGKSFRLIKNDDENNEKVLNSHKNYEKEITQSFVKHALSYCKSHTKTKYVCDGIWTFMFINPEQLKDCAVYIKGTSSLKSGYRALKRDIDEDKRNGLNALQIFKREFRRFKEDVLYAKQNQKDLQYFRSYFEKQSTSESYIEESKKDDDIFITIPDIDKDHIRTVIKTLSNDIDNFQDLLFIKVFDYNIAFDNGKPVGFILVRLKPLGNDKYAGSISIAVDPKQRRKDLAEFLTKNMIEDCRKEDRLEYLYWNALVKNTPSINLAKKLGFKFEGNKKGEEGMYKKFIYPLKKQMNESYIEESSKYPDEVPDEIIDLLKRLNSYDYGYVKDGKKIKGMKNFFENYKSLTISEFEKYEIGVCWDYVHYEAYWFSKHGYRYETFYIQVQDEDNDCPSHTYLVFYLPNSSKVYYFESSWGKYQGIEEFDSINELHKTIKDRHISSARSKCDPKTYFRNKYDAKSSSWEHLGCGEYMVKVSKGRIQLNESYIEESLNLLKKLDEEKVSKEILDIIKPTILTSQNKSKASKLDLDLKCEITEVDSGMVFILVLDGPQEKRDTEEARSLLKDLASKCKSELSDIVSKVDIGDGDEGCLFFTMDKGKIRRKRKDLLESYIEEGYFKSTDNLEFNLDKWSRSGNHNILYITGISGSGKSTIAKKMCKEYNAEYIELDKFTLGIVKGLDRWFENVDNGTYEVHPLLKEYFSQIDHLTTNGSWSKPDMGDEHTKFITWFIERVKGNGTLYIVEGAQFFMKLSNMDPGLIQGEPLIIVGTSALKSWIRRIKRDTADDETISRFIYHLKKDIPMLFKYYFRNEKDLQEYIKNISVNESYTLEFKESEVEGKSIVYFTKDITPQSLLKIYQFMTNPSHGVAPLHGNIGVKISTGEYGGHNFLSPSLIKDLVDYLHGVIVECNTAYVGKRNTTEDHWNTVKAHGFLDIANCDIMDEDGDFSIPVSDPYHIKKNYVGNHLKRYDSILMLSHFKGHAMAGYSGALKNMSIGMASSRGKLHIHTAGKGEDMMKADRDKFLESMVDADMSVMDYMGRENILYVNVANNLSIDCDCDAHPKDPDISDIGIFASTDPVALDQACIDAVYNHPEEKKRNLINRITSRNGTHTIDCAYEKGLGNKHYVILDIDQVIEESVIEEDASVIAAGIFLAVFYGGIAAAKIHQKIKPYLDERKFVYDISFSNKVRDYNYGYKTPKDAIVGYASVLQIKAEKGILLYTDKSSLKDNVKLFKYNKKKKTDIIFDGTYEELCEKYGIKLKPFDKSKLKDRDKVYKQAQSLLKKELSKYSMLKKIDTYNDKDEYDKFIAGLEDYVGIYYSSLWDLVKNARSPEGLQLADEEIWKPLREILKDINDKLPDGYEIVIDNGDWDDISIDLQHNIKLNESVIEEDIENEWAPASFLKRSSKPAKNQKAHAQYLKRKVHSNKTNNATAQSELPKYNQIGEESIEEVVKSQRVKPIFIVTSYTNTTFGKAIKTFTHSQYTHAAIAFDTSLEELYSFNADPKYSSNGYKGGISKESLSSYIDSYDKTIIQVNCIFLKPSDFDKVKETLDKLIENKEDTSYGYLNILNILIGRAKDTGMAMVCSQFVSYILSTADIKLLDKPDNIVTPKDLSTITNPRVYKIFEGYAKDYEKKRMDRIFRKLKTKALLIKESLLDLCI